MIKKNLFFSYKLEFMSHQIVYSREDNKHINYSIHISVYVFSVFNENTFH